MICPFVVIDPTDLGRGAGHGQPGEGCQCVGRGSSLPRRPIADARLIFHHFLSSLGWIRRRCSRPGPQSQLRPCQRHKHTGTRGG